MRSSPLLFFVESGVLHFLLENENLLLPLFEGNAGVEGVAKIGVLTSFMGVVSTSGPPAFKEAFVAIPISDEQS